MAAIKDTLLDKDENEIYPKTVTDNVFDSEGNRLDNLIGSIKENLVVEEYTQTGTSVGTVRYFKCGKICRMQINFSPTSAKNYEWTIPEKFRPKGAVYDIGLDTASGKGLYVYFYDSGEAHVSIPSESQNHVCVYSGTYVTAN